MTTTRPPRPRPGHLELARDRLRRARRDRRRRAAEFRQIFPQPGWVEHDPHEIWSSQLATAREALAPARASAPPTSPRIGITNQRETTIVWDRATGEPIGNAIVWQDRRTAAACDALKARGLEPLFRERTGLVLDAYFSGTKLAWLLDHVPRRARRGERGELAFGTVDTWLIWLLTGGARRRRARTVHATDPTNASRTLLFDVPTRRVGRRAAASCFDVPRAVLPEVHPSSQRLRPDRRPTCSARRSRSAASPATSRARSSARRAFARARSRTPTAPAASC